MNKRTPPPYIIIRPHAPVRAIVNPFGSEAFGSGARIDLYIGDDITIELCSTGLDRDEAVRLAEAINKIAGGEKSVPDRIRDEITKLHDGLPKVAVAASHRGNL